MTQDSPYPPSIRILIIDDNLGDAIVAQSELRKYFPEGFQLNFNHQRFPEKGLEVLARQNIDLVILDPNSNALKPTTRAGITDFLEPMRELGYQTPVICFTNPVCMSMDEALVAGATAYAPKEDYETLSRRVLSEVFQPVNS